MFFYYLALFSRKSFDFSNITIIAPPIMKNIQLKLERFIAGFGASSVVGPINTAYIDPIIRPNIKYIIADLYLFNKNSVDFFSIFSYIEEFVIEVILALAANTPSEIGAGC